MKNAVSKRESLELVESSGGGIVGGSTTTRGMGEPEVRLVTVAMRGVA
jgi:hypothetical protein